MTLMIALRTLLTWFVGGMEQSLICFCHGLRLCGANCCCCFLKKDDFCVFDDGGFLLFGRSLYLFLLIGENIW